MAKSFDAEVMTLLLVRRFERNGSINDLEHDIEAISMVVDAQGHHNPAGLLNNLGSWFCRRLERTGPMDDLTNAVKVASMAVDATPQGHPDRAICLDSLESWFGRRFEPTSTVSRWKRLGKY